MFFIVSICRYDSPHNFVWSHSQSGDDNDFQINATEARLVEYASSSGTRAANVEWLVYYCKNSGGVH